MLMSLSVAYLLEVGLLDLKESATEFATEFKTDVATRLTPEFPTTGLLSGLLSVSILSDLLPIVGSGGDLIGTDVMMGTGGGITCCGTARAGGAC